MSGRSNWLGAALWVASVLLGAGAMMFQERTGPTKEFRGSFDLDGRTFDFALTRSGSSAMDERVAVPNPGGGVTGTLHFKRFKTDDALTVVPLRAESDELVGELPRQPAAGKLEYTIVLATPSGDRIRVPDGGGVVIRFKDPVPGYFLAPHIACMVLVIIFGIRAGLSALIQPSAMARYAWASLGIMTLGGMVLGPIVQKYAFGALWTGFPFGYDLTDNKTLLMWLAWLIACSTLFRRWKLKDGVRRAAIAGATVVMMAVYLIPHSARGSELDYSQLDRGVSPQEAITQGR